MKLAIPEFLRFCIVGGIAFVTDYALLELFVSLGLGVSFARAISLTVALHVSYFLHGFFTFRDHRGYTLTTWVQFLLSNLVGAFINYGVFVAVMHSALLADPRLTRLIALATATAVSMFFNYWGNKRFAFSRKDDAA